MKINALWVNARALLGLVTMGLMRRKRIRFIRDHDKRGVEPMDVVLVQLQKPPYRMAPAENDREPFSNAS